VAVGGLTVGGTGKTPIASWIAAHYANRGLRPAILSRGYGGDEDAVHRRSVPQAIVESAADRQRAARAAIDRGADIFVLDDAFQRLSIRRDLDLCLLSAEQIRDGQFRALPAGPWREGLGAAQRADLVVITGKLASASQLAEVRDRVRAAVNVPIVTATLRLGPFRRLSGTPEVPPTDLAGSTVLVSAGIANPEVLEAQITGLGTDVTPLRWPDHHRYSSRDVELILQKAQGVDYVVVTEKDAAKLGELWPHDDRQPLVAGLHVDWGQDDDRVVSALDALIAHRRL